LNVIIIDDERDSLDLLKYYLSKEKDMHIIADCLDPLKGLEKVLNLRPDAVFLDIEMPEVDGIELAKEIIENLETEIIFITAYNEYAVNAFEVNAVDYILKPICENRLKLSINKLRTKLNTSSNINDSLRNLMKNVTMKNSLFKIPIYRSDKIVLKNISDILVVSVNTKNVEFTVEMNEHYESRKSLIYWENKLSSYNFFRCHRNYIVNLEKIIEIIPWFNNTYILKLSGLNSDIPVGRKYIKDFKNILNI
jgi:DNA-binding LytR/AlgR family response regulator